MDITLTENIISDGKEEQALKYILRNCFRSGFGTLSKTELDLILFTAILKFSDNANLTDYALSRYLQITQQRVRNLKEKASVKYIPITREEAIERFTEKAQSANLEDIYLDIPVFDVAVKNEIEAILEENNILLYSQLNPRIFRLRIDDFLELIILFEKEANPEKSRELVENEVISGIKKLLQQNEQFSAKISTPKEKIGDVSKLTLKEALVKGGISFGIDLLASLVPGGVFLSGPVKSLLNAIKDKI